jgi:TrmH family RNA methyltransferase
MPPQISSLHNPRVKLAAALRERKHRDKQRRFLIDGARELGRALAAGVAIDELFVCQRLSSSAESQAVLAQARSRPIPMVEVTPAVFEKLAFGQRLEGVLGVGRTPDRPLAALVLPAHPLVAVLDSVEKPGNLGAVLRSAEAAGVSAVIAADAATDLFNPAVIRASQGAVFSMPLAEAATADVLAWLRDRRLRVFAARVEGTLHPWQANFREPAAIVLGSEAHGLSAAWQAAETESIRIPMHGQVDSLNVAAAAAVLFYEALRQRSTS